MNNHLEEENGEEGHFTNNNNSGPDIFFLEIEQHEETDSLLRETAEVDYDRMSFLQRHLVFRKTAAKKSSQTNNTNNNNNVVTMVRGLLRQGVGHHFSVRNVAVLITLAVCVLGVLQFLNYDVQHDFDSHSATKKPPPHSTTFGNKKKNNDNNIADELLLLPKENVGHAVQSLSKENLDNENGHYWHHPYKSPFSSQLYADLTEQDRRANQDVFDKRRNAYIAQFGHWVLPVSYDELFHHNNLEKILDESFECGDVPVDYFPDNAWQSNATYTKAFLKQAQALVKRVTEGIYIEYGYGLSSDRNVAAKQKAQRKELFGVIRNNFMVRDGVAVDRNTREPIARGIAFIDPKGWDGLVRKLLHAIMTADTFHVVAVGPASLYKSNNFFKTQVMQFNNVMETVFDKLGVRLISRNMGMDASTTVSALGGADVYGEADILWYIPDDRDGIRPESLGQFDLLQRQAILSGERMPVILTPNPVSLAVDDNVRDKAWIGNIQPGDNNVCKETNYNSETRKYTLPHVKACHFVRCSDVMKRRGRCSEYNSVCWANRTDVKTQPPKQDKVVDVKHQREGYPTSRQHQWEGRKLTLLVLHALEDALNRWSKEANAGRLPLAEDKWHVKQTYEELRESIRTLERKPGKTARAPPCERLLADVDPMICHMSMHVFTEWTPRVNPSGSGLRHIITSKCANNSEYFLDLYHGHDLLPLQWQLKKEDDEIDVHMIAMATNETIDDGEEPTADDADHNEDNGTRRALQGSLATSSSSSLRSRSLSHSSSQVSRSTQLAEDKWTFYEIPLGFCDGSAQSMCNRKVNNTCLLANHNHYKAGVLGHGSSGWLNMTVPEITEGVILLRFDWTMDLDVDYHLDPDRRLSRLDDLPEDLKFDFVINDKKMPTKSTAAFKEFGVEIADDLVVYPVLIDKDMSHNDNYGINDVKLSIRFRTKLGTDFKVLLTHVYYA